VRTALVTGASGFIGRRLCATLQHDGVRVRALVHTGAAEGPWHECLRADLARANLPAGACEGVDTVFHLAGKAHALAERRQDDDDYRRVNVDGTRRVLEAAAHAGVRRIIFASSVKAMGEGDGRNAPLTPYGRSKLDAEGLMTGGAVVEPVVLRLSLVYGPGVAGNLDAMLRAIDQHRFPPLPRVDNRRSLVHVDDVVKIAIASGGGSYRNPGPFVISDGVAYSTSAIYAAMVSVLGRRVPRWKVPLWVWRVMARAGDFAGEVMRRRAPFDSAAYQKLFGSAWYPPADVRALFGIDSLRTLSDALPEMVAAMRA
jgi:nucleoside-diphosphate-sugar epimerase